MHGSDKPTYPAWRGHDRLPLLAVGLVEMDPPPPLVLPRGADGDGDGRLPVAVAALLDHSPGVDAAARARALDASADDYRDRQRPKNTRDSYKADWRRWEDYTAWAGIPMLVRRPRRAGLGFVVWLEHGGPTDGPGSAGSWPGYGARAAGSRRVTGVVYERAPTATTGPIDPRIASAGRRRAGRLDRRRLAAADQRRRPGQGAPGHACRTMSSPCPGPCRTPRKACATGPR